MERVANASFARTLSGGIFRWCCCVAANREKLTRATLRVYTYDCSMGEKTSIFPWNISLRIRASRATPRRCDADPRTIPNRRAHIRFGGVCIWQREHEKSGRARRARDDEMSGVASRIINFFFLVINSNYRADEVD